MKKTHVILLLSIVIMMFVAGISFAQHTVVPWRDNKAGAVSLTLDDNNPVHLSFAIPSMDARGIKGTLFLVTGGIWDWTPWIAAATSGHELGSHSVTHPDLTTLPVADAQAQIEGSKTALDSYLGGKKCVSFAYPYGMWNDAIKGLVQSAGYISGRAVGCALNGQPYNFYNLYACFPEAGLTLDQMKTYTDMAEQQGKWLLTLFHYFDGQYGAWLEPEFIAYLDYLKGKNLWVAPVGSVVKYIKERDASSLYVVSGTSNEIVLQLTGTSLDPAIYDEPLTIRSEVPSHWTVVKVRQSLSETTAKPINEAGNTVIYYNALPNGGNITLTNTGGVPATITFIEPSSARVSTTGFYMMVNGGGFTPTSIVRMGQMQRRTTYISPTQLRAWIMPSDLSKPRMWIISVIDWGQGGAVSNGVTFTVK